jgi:predicted dehydrogenase
MEKLKIGVVGTGHLGKLHTKMFQQISNCELVGIYDSNPDHLAHASKEFNVRAFKSLSEMLDNVDAVSIAVTTSAHFRIAEKCLENNKHVFIEKPITSLISEGEKLVKTAKDKNLFIQVGHIERFNPALLAVEEYIIQPMFIQSDRLAQFNSRGTDVAVVLDLMIHDIDIILSLVKSDVAKIDANGIAVVSENIDIANARIQFVNGAVANVTASRISQKKMRKMRLFQKDNYISLDFIAGVAEVYRLVPADQQLLTPAISFGEMGMGDKKKRVIYEQPEIKEVNALKYELELFVNSVIAGKNPVVTGEDGLRALKVAQIIIEKIEESKVNV